MSIDIESESSDYADADFNDTQVVTGMYQITTEGTGMNAMLEGWSEEGTTNPSAYPSFTSGAYCSGMQTYTSAGWNLWADGYGDEDDIWVGTGSGPGAHGSYSYEDDFDYWYVYPN